MDLSEGEEREGSGREMGRRRGVVVEGCHN